MLSNLNNSAKLPLFILAGGFATRLQGILDGCPKALAPIAEKPFLGLQIEHWLLQGINSFVFLLHHQAEMIIDFLKKEEDGLLKGCKVQYILEPEPMGTGGAVAYAIKKLGFQGDFLLVNSDTWLGAGIYEMMNAMSPSLSVVRVGNISRYGEVLFDEQLWVTAFIEKENKQKAGWISAGLCRLNTDLFKEWDLLPFSIEQITYPKLVAKKALRAIIIESEFIDIGIPDDYHYFCHWIKSNK
jgi:NDP-sugar pyrophosphorylase family protein